MGMKWENENFIKSKNRSKFDRDGFAGWIHGFMIWDYWNQTYLKVQNRMKKLTLNSF